ALEGDDQTLAGAAGGLVGDVRDALDLAELDHLGDLAREGVGVDLVRQLGDHERHPPAYLLGGAPRALGDRAAAGAVGVVDAGGARDGRAGGGGGALRSEEATA